MRTLLLGAVIVLALGFSSAYAESFKPPPPAPLVLCRDGNVWHAPCPWWTYFGHTRLNRGR